MEIRSLLHSAILFHRTVLPQKHLDLYNKIMCRINVHNIKVRKENRLLLFLLIELLRLK